MFGVRPATQLFYQTGMSGLNPNVSIAPEVLFLEDNWV